MEEFIGCIEVRDLRIKLYSAKKKGIIDKGWKMVDIFQEEVHMAKGYDWRPIQDYENDPCEWEQSELRALFDVWREQRDHLESFEAVSRFNEKLKREWAIETGLIERIYVFDRGITELMIERGIDAIPHGSVQDREKVVSMIKDHEAAIESVFDYVKGDRELSTSYIKELHATLTQNQDTVEALDQFGRQVKVPLIKGDYKKTPNNPRRPDGQIHEYCPPEHVDMEMDQLVKLHHSHESVAPEVEAAWLHHRFTQIHPFQDGNGRVARALATLIFVRAGWFPPVVKNDERAVYLDALESADTGDLSQLVKFFARLERNEFVKAIGISGQVIRSNRAEKVVAATKEELQRRRDALHEEWNAAKQSAIRLRQSAKERLLEISQSLWSEMEGLLENPSFYCDEESDQGERSHYYRMQIVETAKALDYFANPRLYRAWARLVMRTNNQTGTIIIAFHGIGHEFRGVLACSAMYFQRVDTDDEGERQIAPTIPISKEVFQINYKEPLEEIEQRFLGWLEESIVRGLEQWQSAIL